MPKGARADQVALTAFAGLIPLAPETVRLFHFGELPSGPEVRVCLSCKKTASWAGRKDGDPITYRIFRTFRIAGFF